VQVLDTSRADPLPGTMPALDFVQLAASEKTTTLTIGGDPVTFYFVQLAFTKDFVDVTSFGVPVDMVLLLSIPEVLLIGNGLIGASGSAVFGLPLPPSADLWGNALPLQVLTVSLSARGRWTNVRDLLIVP
jgi:hypothetical protein